MLPIFFDTRELDKRAKDKFALSEDVLMENAASALEKAVIYQREQISCLILTGSGNNGADGYALARRLSGGYDERKTRVYVCPVSEPKSPMCILQATRAKNCGVEIINIEDLNTFIGAEGVNVIVDCIFGSGYHGELPKNAIYAIECVMQAKEASFIACDVPSGIDINGNVSEHTFCADVTVTMGALKMCLYSSAAKDFCGKIICAPLGISPFLFEGLQDESCTIKPLAHLLEKSDMCLPFREKQNVHKGTFGHVAVISGEKEGASVLSSLAALRFGAGLVTLVRENDSSPLPYVPYELMQSKNIPERANTIALGMGLGHGKARPYFDVLKANPKINAVLDADVFYEESLAELLEVRSKERCSTVLTPHPKEFSSLLKICSVGEYDIVEVQEQRVELAKAFCEKFPNTVLVLKGANVLICYKERDSSCVELYVNPRGSAALAKAGSGDVLSGMIAALLAQGYSAINASITASLAHAYAGASFKVNYALTPMDLINRLQSSFYGTKFLK